MYLKKLELYGFKSFADKVSLNFEKGITAIVGPNGSGKSNISDAIRLVLGEQSIKSLRGSKLEDVIFAGSETRKPLGFCEINLTLDNSDGLLPFDYNEVVITRKIFRSGESEFFINKTPCRLKDVHELFLDTGIGKEGYSVIGQGKIDEILSAKPEERRLILEEAIGISKYRYKKEEAERKLVSAEENLIRLNDIVVELEKQLETLKAQKEKAEKYLFLKEQKKEADISLYAQLAKRAIKRYDEFRMQYDALVKKLEEKTREKQEEEKKFLFLEGEVGKLKRRIEEEKDRYHNLLREIEIVSGQKELLVERVKNLEENIKYYSEELEKLEKKKLLLKEELKKSGDRIFRLQEEKNGLQSKLKEMEEKQKNLHRLYREREEEIEKAKADIIEILNQMAEATSKISLNKSLKEESESKRENLISTKKALEQKLKALLLDKKESEGKLTELQKGLFKLEKAKEDLEEKLKRLEEAFKLKERLLKELGEELEKKKSRLFILEDMERNYEGYSDTVKKLFKVADKRGIVGVVGELIEVEESYRQAIEVALGSNIQNVVVENSQKAAELIEILKKHNLGRLTFLPLDLVKGKKLEGEAALTEEGVMGIASSLVKYAPSLERVFNFLLGRTLVVDTIETAIHLARKYDQAFRIVTLDGELINIGGAITGGSLKSTNTSILSRRNEIKRLRKDIEELLDSERDIKAEVEVVASEKESVKSELKKLEEQIYINERELEATKQGKDFVEKEIQNLEEKMQDISVEIKELDEIISIYRKEIEEESLKLKALEVEKDKLEELVKGFSGQNSKNRDELSIFEKQLTELKIEIAKVGEKLQNEVNNLKEKEREFKEVLKAIKEKEVQIESMKRSIEKLQIEMEESEKALKSLTVEVEKSREYLSSLEEKLFEEEKGAQKGREKFLALQEEYTSLKEKVHHVEMNMQKFQMEIDNIKQRLWEEYNLALEEIIKEEKEEEITNLRIEVERLNEEIKNLGNVNLDSIEEFRQVKERYDFLKNQMEDIIRARESLLSVIEEASKIIKIRFQDGFEVLRAQFKETFKKLFGGGNAELVLTDEKNLLTTGIEIKAQPPGKKLQNLSLLSGGEKALVAISLLFAMLTMKPTPFCVLDEIDAALDDANVDRFAKALKELSKDTQFIVVTHRRGTMMAADAIYGVTMQEKGVSKLLSIKLNTEDRSGGLLTHA